MKPVISKKTRTLAILCCFLVVIGCLLGFSACTPQDNPPSQQTFVNVDHKNITLPSSYDSMEAKGKLNVHYLCVGQADSIFIELPNGKTMLIDAGNSVDAEGIIQYIQELGHTEITYLLATHPHADHIGGMAEVVNAFDIGSVYMPKKQHDTETFEKLLLAIQQKGLKIHTAKAGVSILDENGLTLTLLAPVKDSYQDLNNYSAVLKLTYGQNSFLFMGDAEILAENQITGDVKANVLKVGHHGSDTSTGGGFLKRVSPQYAIICVGPNNTYNHPSETVLKRLSQIGAVTYRTDVNGTVIVSCDKNNMKIHSLVPIK